LLFTHKPRHLGKSHQHHFVWNLINFNFRNNFNFDTFNSFRDIREKPKLTIRSWPTPGPRTYVLKLRRGGRGIPNVQLQTLPTPKPLILVLCRRWLFCRKFYALQKTSCTIWVYLAWFLQRLKQKLETRELIPHLWTFEPTPSPRGVVWSQNHLYTSFGKGSKNIHAKFH
jgi:hypothetical protein